MKTTYDISIVPRNYCNSKYVHDLYDFLDSKHQSAKLEYDTQLDAKRAYKSFHVAKSRYRIYGVKIAKRDNIVYISRVDADLSGITNYDRIRNMSAEELAKQFVCCYVDTVTDETVYEAIHDGYQYETREEAEKAELDWLKSEEWDAD